MVNEQLDNGDLRALEDHFKTTYNNGRPVVLHMQLVYNDELLAHYLVDCMCGRTVDLIPYFIGIRSRAVTILLH